MSNEDQKIEVPFAVDSDGILDVFAVNKSTGVEKHINITDDNRHFSKEQIDKMVKDSGKLLANEKKKKTNSAKNTSGKYSN